MELPHNTPDGAPLLCDVLGLDAGSYDRFLTSKTEALKKVDANAETRIREALLAEMVWPQ